MRRALGRLRHSLSARLMLLFLVTAAVIAAILSFTIGLAVSHHFRLIIRPHIVQYLDYARQDIGNPPDIDKAQALARRVPVEIYIRGPEVNWTSGSEPLDLTDFHFHRRRGRRHGDWLALGERDDRFALKTQAGEHEVYFVVQSRVGHGQGRWIGMLAIAAMLLVLYLMYRAIRWLFRPVQDIQQGVRRIGDGELDYRIPIRRRDELGDLTTSINGMAEEIEKMLDAKRQLLLAISHELRSPITRARVSTELLEDSHLKQEIHRDLREMETLVGELLETERLNTRHSVLNKAPVAVNQLVTEVIDEHFSAQQIETDLTEADPYVLLDAARIKLLIKNLLDNAIRHNGEGCKPPRIATAAEDGELTLVVSDHGAGIAPEHVPHLAEPFYRVDPSRQRKTGGYGLGLYLCRMIVEAHGGSLSIQSGLNQGTDICVAIPVAAGPDHSA